MVLINDAMKDIQDRLGIEMGVVCLLGAEDEELTVGLLILYAV